MYTHFEIDTGFSYKFWLNINHINYSNRRKLGITLEPISSLPCYNPYSLNLQMCKTGDSIGLSARDFDLLIQRKYSNASKMGIFVSNANKNV